MEFKINGYDYNFRIKELSAVDALAFQTQLGFNTTEDASKLFREILEQIEVQFEGRWFAVKEKGQEVYLPANVEKDIILTKQLLDYFLNEYLMPLFQRSSESNE